MLNLFEIIFLCKVTDEVVVVKCFRFDSQRLHLVKYFQSRIDFVTLLRVTKRSSERNVNDKSEEFEWRNYSKMRLRYNVHSDIHEWDDQRETTKHNTSNKTICWIWEGDCEKKEWNVPEKGWSCLMWWVERFLWWERYVLLLKVENWRQCERVQYTANCWLESLVFWLLPISLKLPSPAPNKFNIKIKIKIKNWIKEQQLQVKRKRVWDQMESGECFVWWCVYLISEMSDQNSVSVSFSSDVKLVVELQGSCDIWVLTRSETCV